MLLTVVRVYQYTFVLKESEAHKGHRALVYVIDLAALTYLFFLNWWFRENIVFKFYGFTTYRGDRPSALGVV